MDLVTAFGAAFLVIKGGHYLARELMVAYFDLQDIHRQRAGAGQDDQAHPEPRTLRAGPSAA